jgi:hypothetical protein
MRYLILLALILAPLAGAVDYEFVGGSADKFVIFKMIDSTDGTAKTGLAFGDMSASYVRNNAAADVHDTVAEMATMGTHEEWGWHEVDSTNSPGEYQFGIPDAAIADGAESVDLILRASGAFNARIVCHLIDVDLRAGANVDADLIAVSGNSTAADNLQLQYDTTGLSGDTFPATQASVANIATGSSAVNTTAGSAVVTTGAEVNTYTATVALDGTVHEVNPDGTTEFYYQFDLGPHGVPVSVLWDGYANSNGDTYTIKAYNWVGTAWEQIGTKEGTPGSTVVPVIYDLTTAHVGTGANEGLVRWQVTSADGTGFNTDRILCSFAVVSPSAGYANGAIWVDTVSGTAGTEDYVNGTADNPVLTWANALTISTSLGIKRFQIVNGSTIALSANSDNFTLLGSHWALELESQSIDGMFTLGAHITGIGTATAIAHFDTCSFGAVTLPPSKIVNSGIGETSGQFTAGSDGEYVFSECYSLVPGSGSPALVFTGLGSATGVNNRGWKGGATYTLDSDITLSHEVLAGGGTTITTGGADVEVRGITRALTVVASAAETVQFVGTTGPITLSGTTTATFNLYGVAASLSDTTSAGTTNDFTVTNTSINAEADTALADYDGPTNTEMLSAHTDTDADIAALNDVSTAQVNAEVDTALADYDGPTDTEMLAAHTASDALVTARSLLAADYFLFGSDTVANVGTTANLTTNNDKTDYTLSITGLAEFLTDDTGETTAVAGSVGKIAQGAAGGNVTVEDFTQAALAKFATLDTGETTAVAGSVIKLSQALEDGDTLVNQDTGGPNAMQVLDTAGAPVAGAYIRCYRKVDYDADDLTTLRGSDTTNDDGAWHAYLSTGVAYTITADYEGRTDIMEVTP